MHTSGETIDCGNIISFELGEQEGFLGLDPRPIIDISVTFHTEGKGRVRLVAFDHEWEQLIQQLTEKLADKQEREEEEQESEAWHDDKDRYCNEDEDDGTDDESSSTAEQ